MLRTYRHDVGKTLIGIFARDEMNFFCLNCLGLKFRSWFKEKQRKERDERQKGGERLRMKAG